jgi:hypothetical protein
MSIKVGVSNLRSLDKKYYKEILTNLYSCINLYKLRYQIINDKNHLDEIKNGKYIITSHFQGHNYIYFMTLINNSKYNLLISKKELKYNLEQNNINEIKIFILDTNSLDDCYYKNTIFDGRLIRNHKSEGFYIVQENYMLCGNNIQTINIKDKLSNLENVIDMINLKINKEQNVEFKLCRLYEYNELPDLIFNKIKNTQLKINGIIFLPLTSQKHYIYTNDSEFEELKNKTINFSNTKLSNSESEFLMKKTNVPDVYELYIDEDNNNYVKEGIAHIPNIKTSHFYKKIFSDKNMIKVKCIKSEKFNKWIPICDDFIDYSEAIF